MSGRLVRVSRGNLRPVTYIVAMPEASKAVELIRSSIGQDGDEIRDMGRVSAELLKALALEPGDFKSTDEPTISQQQQQPQSAA